MVGLVVEVFGRRQIFAPMTRITSIDAGQVITTGLLNMRRFAKRSTETLVIGQMLDRRSPCVAPRSRAWSSTSRWSRPAAASGCCPGSRSRSRPRASAAAARPTWPSGATSRGWPAAEVGQGAIHLVAALADLRPADAATVIHDLPPERRSEVVAALDDERLADVLEELPEEDQVEILEHLDSERAADVLEEMSADDAADLIADLPPETARQLLELMEPEEAEDVRRLMSYEEETAGGMMTPEPVILSPDATVAEALAHVRNEDLTPSLAALVYVVRPPLETPTGRLVGVAHIQRLLREPPSSLVAGALDTGISYLRPEATLEDVAAHLATYNLVAAPVVDDEGRLLGAVTVDDLLDHLLPEGWRDRKTGSAEPVIARRKHEKRPRRGADKRQAEKTRPEASRESRRLDTPRDLRRSRLRRPSVNTDAFGVFAEQFARFMGTAAFLIYMTLFVVVWVGWNLLAPEDLPVRQLPVHLPDPDAQPPGVVRRTADPARAEPAGGARPGDRRAGPAGQRARPRRHGVPGPRGRLAADGAGRGRHPRLPALGAARAAQRARRAQRRR